MIVNDGRDCDMWYNKIFATWHINYILEKYENIKIYFSS
jgi:hypothetical protein